MIQVIPNSEHFSSLEQIIANAEMIIADRIPATKLIDKDRLTYVYDKSKEFIKILKQTKDKYNLKEISKNETLYLVKIKNNDNDYYVVADSLNEAFDKTVENIMKWNKNTLKHSITLQSISTINNSIFVQ